MSLFLTTNLSSNKVLINVTGRVKCGVYCVHVQTNLYICINQALAHLLAIVLNLQFSCFLLRLLLLQRSLASGPAP